MIYQNRKPFNLGHDLEAMAKKTRQQREQQMYNEWCEYMETGIITTREVYNPKYKVGSEQLYCRALIERYIE